MPDIETHGVVRRYRELERPEESTVTKHERKDIGWIIAAFTVVFVVACAGLFGSFGLLASTH
jgi:hypothetical protein